MHIRYQQQPDITSVRTLITSATRCARECGITVAAIYRWIKVNRIPGKYLTKVANLYDVELRDLLPLTGSEISCSPNVVLKPKNTLQVLIEVQKGNLTIDQASKQLGVSVRSLNSVLFNWGEKLPLLYATLQQLDQKQITLDQACNLLGVAKYTLHGLRRKYGFAPGVKRAPKPVSSIELRKQAVFDGIPDVLRGKLTAKDLAKNCGVSYRTVFRYIDKIEPSLNLNEITNWPISFRLAYVEEVVNKHKRYIREWLKFAEAHRLYLPKRRKMPETPSVWSGLPLKRLVVGVLLDEASLEAIAVSRKADPEILRNLFSQDLQPLGLNFDLVSNMGVLHQQALADLLLAVLDRRRRTVNSEN